MTARVNLEESRVSPIYQLVFVLALSLLFVVLSKLYMDGYAEIQRLESRLDAEKKRYAEGLGTNQRLESEISLLKTDEGVEMVARDKLRFIRPDEVVILPLK